MREDEITVRTQLAELKTEQRAQRERLETMRSESLRRHDSLKEHDVAHAAEDTRRFDKIDETLDKVRETLAALATSSAVTNVKVLFLVAIAGALGSAAVAVVQHMIFGGGT